MAEYARRLSSSPCCKCHSPLVTHFNWWMAAGITRRAILGGSLGFISASPLRASRRASAAQDAKSILFTNVRIFDGLSSSLRQGLDVLVTGNTITDLVPAGQEVAGARLVDGGGGVLMPGLIDAHWHALLADISEIDLLTADVPYVHFVAAQEAERTLLRGFTTVRDVGGPAFALKRAIDEGMIAGPRIYPSGAMITQTGGHFDFRFRFEVPRSTLTDLSHGEEARFSAIADGVPEVLRRAREQLMLGASQVKIAVGGGVSSTYDPLASIQFTPDEIRAAVESAEDWGTYVCAHVYVPAGIHRALDNGVMSIEHGQLADEETVRKIADAGAWWSLQPFLDDEDSNPKATPQQQADQKAVAEGTMRAFELGQKHNVNMVWGTDILFNPGKTWTQNRQLSKLSRWFDTSEVLKLATSHTGNLLAMSGGRNPYPGRLGVIEAGAFADLLVIDGNPLEDISLIADPDRNMKLIMKDGVIYKDELVA